MSRYVAVLMPEAGGYHVLFPDLPGCTTFGADLDAAMVAARYVMAAKVIAVIASGARLPPARDLDAIRRDARAADGTMIDLRRAILSVVQINRGAIDTAPGLNPPEAE